MTLLLSASISYPDSIALTVNPVNDAPVAANDVYSTPYGTLLVVPASGGVLSNDLDVDSATLSATLLSDPAHGDLIFDADGGFVYTPTVGFGGSDSFSYYASDGITVSTPATVTLIVGAVPTYTLTISTMGLGSVSLDPPGDVYSDGAVVTLTATPDPGSVFVDWTGDLITTTNPVSLTMDSDKAITATFSEIVTLPPTYTLSVDVVGQGTVAPASGVYTEGEVITLEATPDAGWQFDAWSGDLITGSSTPSLTNPISLTMDADKAITATFSEITANQAPTANAGDPQTVNVGEEVLLDGSSSFDPDDDALIYLWRQGGGPAISFTADISRTTFIAPPDPTVLTFTLMVTDTGGLSDGDEVIITVEPSFHTVFLPLVMRE